MVIDLAIKMKGSFLGKISVIVLLMFFLSSCGGSKEQEEKNAQLQQETKRLQQEINASTQQWGRLYAKIAEVVDSVDPILLKELLGNNKEPGAALEQLDKLTMANSDKSTIHIDSEQLILRIKKFQGEVLFRSWIDTVAERNVVAVQHLKSTEPVVPGEFNLAVKLWEKTRGAIEKKIAAGQINKVRLQDAKMNFINKLREIDSQYEKQVKEQFPKYLRNNSYEKAQVDSDHFLNGQFRTGGLHTISFKVTPVTHTSSWAVVIELVSKSSAGEKILKSFELNPVVYKNSYEDSFTVLVKN